MTLRRLLLSAFAVGAVLCFGLYASLAWFSGPRIEVSPSIRHLVVSSNSARVGVRFSIFNRGGKDLIIHRISTSCGCTAARVGRVRIGGGTSTELEVEAVPPAAGQRVVTIDCVTNDPEHRIATVLLSMRTDSPVPFVQEAPDLVNFGFLTSTEEVSTFKVVTEERRKSPRWFDSVSSSEPGLGLALTLTREWDVGDSDVMREYEIRAQWNQLPPAGTLTGEIRLDPGTKGPKAHEVSFRASRRSSVYAIPTVLLVRAPGRCRLVVAGEAVDQELLVRPSALPSFLEVREVGSLARNRIFDVRAEVPPEGRYEGQIDFVFGESERTRLVVPIRVVRDGY